MAIGGEVVFQCRDEGSLRAPVKWIREGGRPLPQGSTDSNGRLEIPNVQVTLSFSIYIDVSKNLIFCIHADCNVLDE